jgi:lipoic acid synthetase
MGLEGRLTGTDDGNARGASPRKPAWIRVRAGCGARTSALKRLVDEHGLHTVCREALCPNLGECWEKGRATIMILGDACSRHCAFCGVTQRRSGVADAAEPERVAQAVARMGLREIVVTSVTRDDLPDGGATVWAETIRRLRALDPPVLVEVLVPDFEGKTDCIERVLAAGPDVWAHNLETVPSLYGRVRPQADYARSLDVLRAGVRAERVVKTGIMVGLGETREEVRRTMSDARAAGSRIFTVGQYLQPSRRSLPVARYVPPDEFDELRDEGVNVGFDVVIAGPLVRSSYHTPEQEQFLRRLGLFRDAPQASSVKSSMKDVKTC